MTFCVSFICASELLSFTGKKKKVEEDVTIDLVEDETGENTGVPGAAMQDAEKNDQVPEDEFGAKDYR